MDTGKDTLKKELEEELKLSTDDLRSHAWYHGQIRREAAESLVEKDGDFLIRDSQSSTGDYVLTCRWKEQPIHFKIIRVVLRPKKGYSRVLFQFEQDQFDNVPALVRFQVGSRKAISDASGAIISRPVNRTLPLRLTGGQQDHSAPQRASTDQLSAWATLPSSTKRLSLNTNPAEMALSNGNLLRNKDKSGSHPASLENLGRRPSMQSSQSDSNLRTGVPQLSQSNGTDCSPPVSPVFRTGSEPLLSPANGHNATLQPGAGPNLRGSDGQLHSRAPPKPLRVSTIFPIPPASWTPDDDPYGEYGELVPRAPILSRGHVDRLRAEEKWQSRARITETSFGFLDSGLSVVFPGGGGDVIAEEDDGPPDGEPHFVRPQVETRSCFRLNLFQSLLLPDNNRPLEPGVLKALKELFTQNDPKTTALHLLHADCQVARITAVTEEQQRLMGVSSGLELITLPHGQQLRKDLLERHHLIALGIAIDILGCTGTVGQRAGVLHKVIQLANELRQTAGDLFAFSAVMKALELPQVHRLEMTWRALRRNHTESAIDFEKKLKPFMKALNEGKAETPLTSIALPHILPLLKVMEGLDLGEHTEQGCELLLCTLGAARTICLNTSQYQARAQTLLSGWEPIPELLEAFRTEFALRLFWGQKGAEVAQKERYEKFDRILDVLSNKLEPAEALAS
ncbi:breast cancer anti-estrogen resistance protein 3 homolog isoform X2 [Amia ocellicauda]